MQTIIIPIVAVVLFLAAFVLFKTAMYASHEEPVEPMPALDIDSHQVAEHLGRAVRCKTVSWPDTQKVDYNTFFELHREFESMYPRVHRTLTREIIANYSLLYTWQGSNPSLAPILLMSHQDVVPVEGGSEKDWEHAPFGGEIADGFVWGRGTLDVKNGVVGALEAVETLLQEGFKPQRTVYLAFGHDEEISGPEGSVNIMRTLQSRGVRLESVIDEGGAVISGAVPGVERPVAMVGVVEKGYMNIELSVQSQGGHSSAPQPVTAIGRLSRAIERIETRQMPDHIDFVRMQFDAVASELPFGLRMLFGNLWLFGGVVKRQLAGTPNTNALIRTTTAPTIFHAGVKDNILPRQASAVVNFRLLPGDTIQSVTEHVRKTVADDEVHLHGFLAAIKPGESVDPDAEVAIGGWEASPVTDTRGPVFSTLTRTIREVFPDAVVAPYLVGGATDSRYFAPICDQIMRFSPVRLQVADMERMHGVNERLSVKGCGDMVRFFHRWIQVCAGGTEEKPAAA
jgi:carboxypeptidase PM20D1